MAPVTTAADECQLAGLNSAVEKKIPETPLPVRVKEESDAGETSMSESFYSSCSDDYADGGCRGCERLLFADLNCGESAAARESQLTVDATFSELVQLVLCLSSERAHEALRVLMEKIAPESCLRDYVAFFIRQGEEENRRRAAAGCDNDALTRTRCRELACALHRRRCERRTSLKSGKCSAVLRIERVHSDQILSHTEPVDIKEPPTSTSMMSQQSKSSGVSSGCHSSCSSRSVDTSPSTQPMTDDDTGAATPLTSQKIAPRFARSAVRALALPCSPISALEETRHSSQQRDFTRPHRRRGKQPWGPDETDALLAAMTITKLERGWPHDASQYLKRRGYCRSKQQCTDKYKTLKKNNSLLWKDDRWILTTASSS